MLVAAVGICQVPTDMGVLWQVLVLTVDQQQVEEAKQLLKLASVEHVPEAAWAWANHRSSFYVDGTSKDELYK